MLFSSNSCEQELWMVHNFFFLTFFACLLKGPGIIRFYISIINHQQRSQPCWRMDVLYAGDVQGGKVWWKGALIHQDLASAHLRMLCIAGFFSSVNRKHVCFLPHLNGLSSTPSWPYSAQKYQDNKHNFMCIAPFSFNVHADAVWVHPSNSSPWALLHFPVLQLAQTDVFSFGMMMYEGNASKK